MRLAVSAPLAAVTAAWAAQAYAGACVAEDDLSPSESSMRRSLRYEEPSTDAAKICGGCAFYKSESGGCGKCQLLNGAVSVGGRCESWAPKPK